MQNRSGMMTLPGKYVEKLPMICLRGGGTVVGEKICVGEVNHMGSGVRILVVFARDVKDEGVDPEAAGEEGYFL